MSKTWCPPQPKIKSLNFLSYDSSSGLLHYPSQVLVYSEDKNLLLLSVDSLAVVKGVCVANPNPLMFHMTFSIVLHGNIIFQFKSLKNNYGIIDEKQNKTKHVFRPINNITKVKYSNILKNTSRYFLCDAIFNFLIKLYLMAKPLALFTAQNY